MEVNHLIVFVTIWFSIIGTALIYLFVIHKSIDIIASVVEKFKDVNPEKERAYEQQ